MIEREELRIGNWVFDAKSKSNVQVAGIQFTGRCVVADNSYDDGKRGIEPEGITITARILKKAGFIKSSDFYILMIGDYLKLSTIYSGKGIKLFGDGEQQIGASREIIYLHQLQNLFFAITGEELKIEGDYIVI